MTLILRICRYESQLSLLEKGAETIKADQVQLGTQRLN